VYVSAGIWDRGWVLRLRHGGLVRRWGEIFGKMPLLSSALTARGLPPIIALRDDAVDKSSTNPTTVYEESP